ncbi:MAG: hypothetical protein EOO89_12775 [Pedobacter sp.]|nr:MAG: hypothetical protein EOO89_12775 [Pedobacter sp.]
MSEIKQHAVLTYISETIKSAIADAKLEKQSDNIAVVRDGNDQIHLEQLSDGTGNITIQITDKKEILYSEDLLETLQNIEEGTESQKELYGALSSTVVVVNGLSIETDFVFQAVKDCFDTLSSSYQFVKTISKRINGLTISFQFGDHKFQLVVVNDPENVTITSDLSEVKDAKVKKTIESDVTKVQQALNKMFKE